MHRSLIHRSANDKYVEVDYQSIVSDKFCTARQASKIRAAQLWRHLYRLLRAGHRIESEDGVATIEFCVSLPVFVFVFLASVDLGLVMQKALLVSSAAATGARYAMVGGHSTDVAGMQAAAQAQAGCIGGFHVTATSYYTCPPGTGNVSYDTVCASGALAAHYVQVATNATVPLLFNLASLPNSMALTGNAVLRVQRP